jgi:hypothetical protein
MHWVIYVTSLHRIVMNVFQFLPHHFIVLNQLRVGAFLPQLAFPIHLVFCFEEFQLLKKEMNSPLFEEIDDLSGREGFEISHFLP